MIDYVEKLKETVRAQGKAESTGEAYGYWLDRYLSWCRENRVGKETKAEVAVERYLSMLANVLDVSATTQNQAFAALCYFYLHVVKRPLEGVSALRAKRPDRIRDVLDESEIVELFNQLSGVALLSARMMYASSFRIGEIGRIRIKDISFERRQIVVRGAKGEKDRIVGFPEVLHDAVRRQIESMKVLWKHDLADGLNGVSLPHAFGRKSPSSHREFAWWYLLTSDNYSRDPISGNMYRHHQDMGHIARQIKNAAQKCGFAKRVTSHCLRHSFACHSLENNVPIHVVQQIMGHTSVETTQRYLHVKKDGVTSAKSPLTVLEQSPLKEFLSNPELSSVNRKSEDTTVKLRLFTG